MDIRSTSSVAGAFCWAEAQLFETLGAWLHELDDVDTLVLLGERCTRHGERLTEWSERIAAIPGIEAAELVAPSGPIDRAPFDALRAERGSATERLNHYRLVVRHLDDQYRLLRTQIDPLIDGPTARLVERSIHQFDAA
jgi:hypothetical protein